MNKEETVTLLKKLSVSFPTQFDFPTGNESIDRPMVDTWQGKLSQFDRDVADEAVERICKSDPRFPPNLYQVVAEARDIMKEQLSERKRAVRRQLNELREKAIDDELTADDRQEFENLKRKMTELNDRGIKFLTSGSREE